MRRYKLLITYKNGRKEKIEVYLSDEKFEKYVEGILHDPFVVSVDDIS